MLISAPLLVLSRPLVTFLWALPIEWRQEIGRWSKTKLIARFWTFVTVSLTAWLIHAIAIWAWHAPYLFQLTLRSDFAHIAQHLSFFLTALLSWWTVFYARGRKAYGGAFLYVFTTAVHTSALGAVADFSAYVWYPAYHNSMQFWGLSPLDDQQIGGLIMWITASLVYLAAGLSLCAAWLKESNVRARRFSNASSIRFRRSRLRSSRGMHCPHRADHNRWRSGARSGGYRALWLRNLPHNRRNFGCQRSGGVAPYRHWQPDLYCRRASEHS